MIQKHMEVDGKEEVEKDPEDLKKRKEKKEKKPKGEKECRSRCDM